MLIYILLTIFIQIVSLSRSFNNSEIFCFKLLLNYCIVIRCFFFKTIVLVKTFVFYNTIRFYVKIYEKFLDVKARHPVYAPAASGNARIWSDTQQVVQTHVWSNEWEDCFQEFRFVHRFNRDKNNEFLP